jgi:hypothetical protein
MSMKYLLIGITGVSYSYGYCRSWTLPWWSSPVKKEDRLLRAMFAATMGIGYVIPPFCVMKYVDLVRRIDDQRHYRARSGEHWKEWGYDHPRVW